jgi:hypothetical protein
MRNTSSREDCRQGNCLKPVELEQGTPMRRALVRTKAIEFQDGASSRGTRTPIMVYARPAGYYATSGRESANGPSGTAEAKTAKSNRIPQSRTLPQCVQIPHWTHDPQVLCLCCAKHVKTLSIPLPFMLRHQEHELIDRLVVVLLIFYYGIVPGHHLTLN